MEILTKFNKNFFHESKLQKPSGFLMLHGLATLTFFSFGWHKLVPQIFFCLILDRWPLWAGSVLIFCDIFMVTWGLSKYQGVQWDWKFNYGNLERSQCMRYEYQNWWTFVNFKLAFHKPHYGYCSSA